MADQNIILKTLVERDQPMSLDQICKAILRASAPVGSPERKQTVKCLGHLIGSGLVRPIDLEMRSYPGFRRACYEATSAGRKFVKDGRSVSEHVLDYPAITKPKVGTKANGEAFRVALWKVFRFARKGTLHDLIEAAGNHGVVKVDTLASAWMKALIRAGIAVELQTRARGFAPTSNGFKRYALVRDLGPKAPSIATDFVLDNNTGERLPFTTTAAKAKVA